MTYFMTDSPTAISVDNLTHRYAERVALDNVSFKVRRGEMFGLLGPNGGGKTTLFKILSTLMMASSGEAQILDAPLSQPARVREHLGVVFQQPSIDGKLTVRENLWCHGYLYGLQGAELKRRSALLLTQLGLSDRVDDMVDTLSGGLQRRAELAKSLLHQPPVLLLDEPSTGLDPGARRDFMHYLQRLRDEQGVTIVLTTHYMEEAERCDHVAILHQGKLVKVASPEELKASVGGDIVAVQATDPEALAVKIEQRFGCTVQRVDGALRIERKAGHELVRDLVDAFPTEIVSITYGKPTLEDVFISLTGHRFWAAEENS